MNGHKIVNQNSMHFLTFTVVGSIDVNKVMFLYDWININAKLQTSQTEGYGLGLLANVSEALAGIKLGEAEL